MLPFFLLLYRPVSLTHVFFSFFWRGLCSRWCFMRAKLGKFSLRNGARRKKCFSPFLCSPGKSGKYHIEGCSVEGAAEVAHTPRKHLNQFSRGFREYISKRNIEIGRWRLARCKLFALVANCFFFLVHVAFSGIHITMMKFHISQNKNMHLWRLKWTFFASCRTKACFSIRPWFLHNHCMIIDTIFTFFAFNKRFLFEYFNFL